MEINIGIEGTQEYERALQLVQSWESQSLESERFEYVEVAANAIAKAKITGVPLMIVSPICLNYETLRIKGQRRPTLHEDLIWTRDYSHLRRGYVLLHEEIPCRLGELNRIGVPVNHLIIAVDLGMSEQLYTVLNPSADRIPVKELRDHIEVVTESNVATMRQLIIHGLEQQTINTGMQLNVNVLRLTTLVQSTYMELGYDFTGKWREWNACLRQVADLSNNRWGALIRTAIEKDGRYLREHWGYTTEKQITKRVIDENFGLTAAFADAMHVFGAYTYQVPVPSRRDIVMLDTIPGPQNPGHTEFYSYNMDHPDGSEREKMGVLRPFHNLVLLSDIACPVPFLQLDPDVLLEQAEGFGF